MKVKAKTDKKQFMTLVADASEYKIFAIEVNLSEAYNRRQHLANERDQTISLGDCRANSMKTNSVHLKASYTRLEGLARIENFILSFSE